MQEKNRGSSVVEVTMIMPLIIMLFVFGIGALLHAYQQGAQHGKMMASYTKQKEKADNLPLVGTWFHDAKEYAKDTELVLIKPYPFTSTERLILRVADKENDLRRLDVYGDTIRNRRIQTVSDSSDGE